MAMDDKTTSVDLTKKGQQFAHELTEGSTTGNINYKLWNIDSQINSMQNPADRQQVLYAMDRELTEKGILPSALRVFAEQEDNHNILKADRRGMHADTLGYNLDPSEANNASKLKGGHWDYKHNPVEMMLTKELLNNTGRITAGSDNDEITYGRLNDFARKSEEHNVNTAGATAMLKQYDNANGFYGLSHGDTRIKKDDIENALSFPQNQLSKDRPTLEWMKDNFKNISDHGGITPSSMRRYAEQQGVNPFAVEAEKHNEDVAGKIDTHSKLETTKLEADKITKAAKDKLAEDKDAAAINAKDTHTVKKGDTLHAIAIAELQAQGKLSETASARDLALAHKQIAYEEHLIRLYTPKIFSHLPNYNGKMQENWVLNLVPERERQLELDANKQKHHPAPPAPPTVLAG